MTMAATTTHIFDGAEVTDEELAIARRYPMVIHWSDEDDAYLARFPGLPGIGISGRTPAEAAQKGQEVIVVYVIGHIDAGLPLPEPVAHEQIVSSRNISARNQKVH